MTNFTEDAGQQVRVSRTLSLTVEDPVDVGRKSPSPSRHPPSNVVHVTGLVRPFTLGQLKELLGRTGNLQPDGFWIDNIKSHCYVVVCINLACIYFP
jgi:apoptotic chromatin condensation inducer in the nucleus